MFSRELVGCERTGLGFMDMTSKCKMSSVYVQCALREEGLQAVKEWLYTDKFINTDTFVKELDIRRKWVPKEPA